MEGDIIEVTWGEEHYKVSDFNGYRVGPFKVTTRIQKGETADQAWDRANKILEDHSLSMFLAKRNGYMERYANRG
jgi:hypothetical protein